MPANGDWSGAALGAHGGGGDVIWGWAVQGELAVAQGQGAAAGQDFFSSIQGGGTPAYGVSYSSSEAP